MSSILKILNIENIRKVFRNFQKVGPVTTLRYVISDFLFDWKYRVETINTIQLEELQIDSPNKEFGRYYEGTNAFVFKQIFSNLKSLNPSESHFVDFGSGKGKAMFMAAEKGFKKVTGIEFSSELVEICKRNLEIFKKKTGSRTEFQVVNADASEYPIPPDANILFFSNPFTEVLTTKVIDNILASYEANPREMWILHLYPQGNHAFQKCPQLKLEYHAKDWFVYSLR